MIDGLQDGERLRAEVIKTALDMNRSGINVNKSGNVSARCCSSDGRFGFVITPSGIPYAELKPESLSFVSYEENEAQWRFLGPFPPSSEWLMHALVYRSSSGVNAVVHTHSPKATAVSCLERGIPPFHYMVAAAGGKDIPCAPYATFGTCELAENAAAALSGRRGCLLAHHGVVATGASLPSAFSLAVEIENLAGMYLDLLKVGDVRTLSDEEMDRVVARFRHYGAFAREGL